MMPSKDFFLSVEDAKNMITKEEYTSLYMSDKLTNMKINPSMIVGQNQQISNNSLTPVDNIDKEGNQPIKLIQVIELNEEEEETDYLDYMSEDMPTPIPDQGTSTNLAASFTQTPRSNFTPRSSFTPRAAFN